MDKNKHDAKKIVNKLEEKQKLIDAAMDDPKSAAAVKCKEAATKSKLDIRKHKEEAIKAMKKLEEEQLHPEKAKQKIEHHANEAEKAEERLKKQFDE